MNRREDLEALADNETGPVVIAMTMTSDDFDRLVSVHTAWGEHLWTSSDRFELTGTDQTIRYIWANAYWVEGGWASVILMRSYLDALGTPYQVVWDTGDDPGYVVLTDYQVTRPT